MANVRRPRVRPDDGGYEHLTDTPRFAHQMWAGDDSAFVGNRHQLGQPINSPNALDKPHPPILVGGTGEEKMLRLVAEYADACNVFDIPDGGATIRHKLGVLERHCADVGRSYDEIEKTVATRLGPDESSEGFAERCGGFAELGLDHTVVLPSGPWTEESVERLARAVPLVRQLGRQSGVRATTG